MVRVAGGARVEHKREEAWRAGAGYRREANKERQAGQAKRPVVMHSALCASLMHQTHVSCTIHLHAWCGQS